PLSLHDALPIFLGSRTRATLRGTVKSPSLMGIATHKGSMTALFKGTTGAQVRTRRVSTTTPHPSGWESSSLSWIAATHERTGGPEAGSTLIFQWAGYASATFVRSSGLGDGVGSQVRVTSKLPSDAALAT